MVSVLAIIFHLTGCYGDRTDFLNVWLLDCGSAMSGSSVRIIISSFFSSLAEKEQQQIFIATVVFCNWLIKLTLSSAYIADPRAAVTFAKLGHDAPADLHRTFLIVCERKEESKTLKWVREEWGCEREPMAECGSGRFPGREKTINKSYVQTEQIMQV